MMKLQRLLLASFSTMLPLLAFSEAPVVDDSANFTMPENEQITFVEPREEAPPFVDGRNDAQALAYDSVDANSNSDNPILLEKLQSLQQELQALRGQLEVQTHDLKLLQQQQLAFYKDVDSRLRTAPIEPTKNQPEGTPPKPKEPVILEQSTQIEAKATQPTSNSTAANPDAEQISYLAAYELVKNKEYNKALSAMQTFIYQHPKSGYTANAQYWLGELYMIKKNYPQAIEHFEAVLQQFPTSSKASASLLKMGYALLASGKNQEAKRCLQDVVNNYPDTNTAQLARTRLKSLGG